MFAVNAPRFQEEFNEGKDYVNKEQLRQAWLDYTEGDAKTEMLDLLLDNSGKVVDWLMYEHGFRFSTPKRDSLKQIYTKLNINTCLMIRAPRNML